MSSSDSPSPAPAPVKPSREVVLKAALESLNAHKPLTKAELKLNAPLNNVGLINGVDRILFRIKGLSTRGIHILRMNLRDTKTALETKLLLSTYLPDSEITVNSVNNITTLTVDWS
jgi:hypothetical protein